MNELMVLAGLPGSGKSTYAENYKDTHTIISSDRLRKEMYGDVNDQDHNAEVFAELERRIRKALLDGENVIYDACNISSKRRKSYLNRISDINCTKRIVVLAAPFIKCLDNNYNRARKVPYEVIRRMYENWFTPAYWEGWGNIKVVLDKNTIRTLDPLLYIDYDQHNPHHKYTLGEHMILCGNWCFLHYDDPVLATAARLHDIGKPFCMTMDGDGVGHYYRHENVGAYDVLADGWGIDISLLVNYHMYPFQWIGAKDLTKTLDKYRKLWGEKFFNRIIALHNCDKLATDIIIQTERKKFNDRN